MRKRGEKMMKRNILLYPMYFALALICLSSCGKSIIVSEAIISKIDQTCDEDGNCIVNLNEIVKFDWDKAAFFREGCSSRELSEALGINYQKSYGASCGMIFVYKDKIVHKETFFMKIDEHNRFRVIINEGYGWIGIITPENSLINAHVSTHEGKDYYSVRIGG